MKNTIRRPMRQASHTTRTCNDIRLALALRRTTGRPPLPPPLPQPLPQPQPLPTK